jgi:Zn-dependent M28 family amino/carboxypeptidase
MDCRPPRLALALAGLALASITAAAPPPSGRGLTAFERAAAARISADEISGHLRFLADDLLEGRSPGTRGDELAARYLAAQLEAMGVAPGAAAVEGGAPGYFQPVPLVRLAGQVPPALSVRGAQGELALRFGGGVAADVVVTPSAEVDRVDWRDAELVFVGYGITAPEQGWDDYRGVDVRGKVVVVLNFNPPFAGEGVRTWYGRWPYKYRNAADHGAVGAILVHTTASAAYPWQVLAANADGVAYELPPEPGEARLTAQLWIAEPAARRLFALAGLDLDERTRAAQAPGSHGFAAQPLGLRASLDMPVTRTQAASPNVIGIVRGTDPRLREEVVVFSAHHDHLGTVPPIPPATDGIYNGALDNASGCAAVLAIARAAVASPPRRSLLFVFTTAEERGLLGARWFAHHPPIPVGRMAADVNLDAINVWGRTRDVGLLGLGRSSVDGVVRAVAAAQGRTVHGDAFPDRGSYYRSDHLELARLGVPDVSVGGGPTYRDRPAGWGEAVVSDFIARHYHQVSDEYRWPERWDLSGAVEDAQLQLIVGLRLANATSLPRWKKGDEFEAARLSAAR